MTGETFALGDTSALKSIKSIRNEIEHYEFSLNEQEARVIIGNVLSFIFRFSCDELGLDWANEQIRNPKWARLIEFSEFYLAQLSRINEMLEDAEIEIIDCPVCFNDTFDVESEICLLCGHEEEILACNRCGKHYLYSTVELEEANLCRRCEYENGYAAANCEKY